jgi:hypothetical protein
MGKTLILFSPALAAHLSKEEPSGRRPDIQTETRERNNLSKNYEQQLPIIRARNIGSTRVTDSQYFLPALLGIGAVGAGIGILYARKHSILQYTQARLATMPHTSMPPSLIFTFSSTNIICAGTILYTHQGKQKDSVKAQRDLLNAWEEEAKRSAKGRALALAEHYEAHLESLREEYRSAQCEIERHYRDLQISQAVALATAADGQISIRGAERRALKAANDAHDVFRKMDDRVRKLETEKFALIDRMRRIEAENVSMNASVRSAEHKTTRCQERVEKMEKRASGPVRTPRSPSVSDLWLDEG